MRPPSQVRVNQHSQEFYIMDGLLDLKADFTIYEVGIMNTHTGVDEDPPRDQMFYFFKTMLEINTHHFCCNFDIFKNYIDNKNVTWFPHHVWETFIAFFILHQLHTAEKASTNLTDNTFLVSIHSFIHLFFGVLPKDGTSGQLQASTYYAWSQHC